MTWLIGIIPIAVRYLVKSNNFYSNCNLYGINNIMQYDFSNNSLRKLSFYSFILNENGKCNFKLDEFMRIPLMLNILMLKASMSKKTVANDFKPNIFEQS